MTIKPPHSEEEDIRYRKLDAIDTKTGALLAVTSILLVFISLPPIFEEVRPSHAVGFKLVFMALLTSCLISLFVLFFKEHTSESFVEVRKYALNTAVFITAACCLAVIVIVGASL
jgi:uncharacterized membrane protein